MDNIILGLLLLCSRSIYQLHDRIEKGLNLMYSNSMGSIQVSIKKLLKGHFIEYHEIIENGKYKKIYAITEKGKQSFLSWVNQPIQHNNFKCPELTKIYFMGFSNPKNRIENIQNYIAFLKTQYLALKVICEDAKKIKIDQQNQDILYYQMVSAFYGKDLYQFNINWYENLLKKMKVGGGLC